MITILAVTGIVGHLYLRYVVEAAPGMQNALLWGVFALGGVPLLIEILREIAARDFGADLLAGISIVASALLGQWLAGAIIILMLSGGRMLERMAVRRASSVLDALARRVPLTAHRKQAGQVQDIQIADIAPGDTMVIFPHEICPVDGVVMEGRGRMDESYLTGEPFEIEKAPGSRVLSGAINKDSVLIIRAEKLAKDSRYAKIMEVMRAAEKESPNLRRVGDRIGAAFAPWALAVAAGAWWASGDPMRFLSVLMVATPCPLLIAIPVAVIGAISLAAKRSIIIKTPAMLEQVSTCETIIFDKTGTLTYGTPQLTDVLTAPGFSKEDVLGAAASLERYSKHPLAGAIIDAAEKSGLPTAAVGEVSEKPGWGLAGNVAGRSIRITGRKIIGREALLLPPASEGLECVVLVDGAFAAVFRFHDAPRKDSRPFIRHLSKNHRIRRALLLSGDRESEVRYLAQEVGISEIHAGKSPEEKVAIVKAETQRGRTLFVGDGINDAPALLTATVGIALGQNSDVTSEAADAVILDASWTKVDELLHIGHRMRTIALQSALGGILLSLIGMGFAAAGYLPPVAGAVVQELIDLAAVLNAVRVALPPSNLSDIPAS
ncbi:MAG: cadmium-translocating P-type ATPase [Elusimicrobia bacterium RIFCSPLOWO2_01_FULL_59_12]|nr:MAG: cadmium-translocating P-type ATPase [Elusimicrobia bacterium RIFCSPLOWO2_01_FULL_59_12]